MIYEEVLSVTFHLLGIFKNVFLRPVKRQSFELDTMYYYEDNMHINFELEILGRTEFTVI